MIYANIDRDGNVHFDILANLNGTVPVAQHESKQVLKDYMGGICRHAYDNKSLIVSGVRDAGEDSDKALAALSEFRDRVADEFKFQQAEWR